MLPGTATASRGPTSPRQTVLPHRLQEPGATASLHAQLWNHAVSLMEGQAFERALRVLSAVAALAAGSEAQAAALRAQALCCNSMGSFDRCVRLWV